MSGWHLDKRNKVGCISTRGPEWQEDVSGNVRSSCCDVGVVSTVRLSIPCPDAKMLQVDHLYLEQLLTPCSLVVCGMMTFLVTKRLWIKSETGGDRVLT